MHVLCVLLTIKPAFFLTFYLLGSELIKADDWFRWSRWRAADVCVFACVGVCACVRACVRRFFFFFNVMLRVYVCVKVCERFVLGFDF